jgi:hypothetical protein
MAGLVPAIHVFLTSVRQSKDVDARHKAGHDELFWKRGFIGYIANEDLKTN